MKRTALIIGGGPAGLTVALELLRRTDIKPIVLEPPMASAASRARSITAAIASTSADIASFPSPIA